MCTATSQLTHTTTTFASPSSASLPHTSQTCARMPSAAARHTRHRRRRTRTRPTLSAATSPAISVDASPASASDAAAPPAAPPPASSDPHSSNAPPPEPARRPLLRDLLAARASVRPAHPPLPAASALRFRAGFVLIGSSCTHSVCKLVRAAPMPPRQPAHAQRMRFQGDASSAPSPSFPQSTPPPQRQLLAASDPYPAVQCPRALGQSCHALGAPQAAQSPSRSRRACGQHRAQPAPPPPVPRAHGRMRAAETPPWMPANRRPPPS